MSLFADGDEAIVEMTGNTRVSHRYLDRGKGIHMHSIVGESVPLLPRPEQTPLSPPRS